MSKHPDTKKNYTAQPTQHYVTSPIQITHTPVSAAALEVKLNAMYAKGYSYIDALRIDAVDHLLIFERTHDAAVK